MRTLLVLLVALILAGCVTERRALEIEGAENRRLVEESIRRQGCLLERTAFQRALCFERVRTF